LLILINNFIGVLSAGEHRRAN